MGGHLEKEKIIFIPHITHKNKHQWIIPHTWIRESQVNKRKQTLKENLGEFFHPSAEKGFL